MSRLLGLAFIAAFALTGCGRSPAPDGDGTEAPSRPGKGGDTSPTGGSGEGTPRVDRGTAGASSAALAEEAIVWDPFGKLTELADKNQLSDDWKAAADIQVRGGSVGVPESEF